MDMCKQIAHRVVGMLASLAVVLAGSVAVGGPARAAGSFGSANPAWKAYYNAPGNTATWPGFCAGGGGTVRFSAQGVPACGPTGTTDIEIPGGISTPGFQCVELSERFLYVKRGWTTLSANGAQVASVYSAAHHAPLVRNGTAGIAPHVGDVMSFSNTNFTNRNEAGHTGVVTASNVDGSGNGSITLMSENVSGNADLSNFKVASWKVASVFGYASSQWVQSGRVPLHTGLALIPNAGASGYSVDGRGQVRAFGSAPAPHGFTTWATDVVRGIALNPSSTLSAASGYVLDEHGGLHPFAAGSAAVPLAATGTYWPTMDIARGIIMISASTGYVLDGLGGLHTFGPTGTKMPVAPVDSAYWPNWDIARGLVLTGPSTGFVLDGLGGLHPFGPAGSKMPAAPVVSAYWPNWDIARSIALIGPSRGYVLDGFGGVHPFAPAGVTPPSAQSPGWTNGDDSFRGIAADPGTGTVVDIRAFNDDGSGGTRYSFHVSS